MLCKRIKSWVPKCQKEIMSFLCRNTIFDHSKVYTSYHVSECCTKEKSQQKTCYTKYFNAILVASGPFRMIFKTSKRKSSPSSKYNPTNPKSVNNVFPEDTVGETPSTIRIRL